MRQHVADAPALRGPRSEQPHRQRGSLGSLGLDHRRLPEAPEQGISAASAEQYAVRPADEERGRMDLLRRLLLREQRQDVGLTLAARDTDLEERAGRATRLTRQADGGTELHQRLVEGARMLRRHRLFREPPDHLLGAGEPQVFLDAEHAREDPHDVAVDEGGSLPVDKARDGAGGVGPDAADSEELRHRGREIPREARDDVFRSFVEPAGAAVVSEPAPQREDLFERGVGEVLETGKPSQEPAVERHHGGNAGLLQHHLADPDAVARPIAAPRQVASVGREPGREEPGEDRWMGGRRQRQSLRETTTWLMSLVENPAG